MSGEIIQGFLVKAPVLTRNFRGTEASLPLKTKAACKAAKAATGKRTSESRKEENSLMTPILQGIYEEFINLV
jgi:hypothetical protein